MIIIIVLPVHSSCWSWWQAHPGLARWGSCASGSTPSESPAHSWISVTGEFCLHLHWRRQTSWAASWFGIAPNRDSDHVFSGRFSFCYLLQHLAPPHCHFGTERTISGSHSSRNTESPQTSWQCRAEEGCFPQPAGRTPLAWATGSARRHFSEYGAALETFYSYLWCLWWCCWWSAAAYCGRQEGFDYLFEKKRQIEKRKWLLLSLHLLFLHLYPSFLHQKNLGRRCWQTAFFVSLWTRHRSPCASV